MIGIKLDAALHLLLVLCHTSQIMCLSEEYSFLAFRLACLLIASFNFAACHWSNQQRHPTLPFTGDYVDQIGHIASSYGKLETPWSSAGHLSQRCCPVHRYQLPIYGRTKCLCLHLACFFRQSLLKIATYLCDRHHLLSRQSGSKRGRE